MNLFIPKVSSALRPRSFAIVSDILTLAASIQDRKRIPRTLIRNGKRSKQDLSTWRASEKCQVAAANDALTYSQRSASSISPQENESEGPNENLAPMPLLPAQSIASSVIAKDLYSLKTKVDELQLRMNTLEQFSNLGLVKNELEQIESVVNDMAHVPIPKTTATTQTTQSYTPAEHLLLEMVQNNDLFITSLCSLSSGPSYTYFRGDIHTTTDYIISDARHAHLAIRCETHDHHPLNSLTTYHSP